MPVAMNFVFRVEASATALMGALTDKLISFLAF
jgi:hypothetical protein